MFTLIKIRDGIETYEDPGWYAHPPGTVARKISGPATTQAATYHCIMHEEVTSKEPGRCRICTMKLTPKK